MSDIDQSKESQEFQNNAPYDNPINPSIDLIKISKSGEMSDSDETSDSDEMPVPTPEQLERLHEINKRVIENMIAEQKARIPPRDDPINPSIDNILIRMTVSGGINPPDTKRFFINNNGKYRWEDWDGECANQTDDPRSIYWQNYPYKEPSTKITTADHIPEGYRWMHEYFIQHLGYVPNDEWWELNRAEIEKQVDLVCDQYSDEVKATFVKDREFYLRNHYNQTVGDFRDIRLNP